MKTPEADPKSRWHDQLIKEGWEPTYDSNPAGYRVTWKRDGSQVTGGGKDKEAADLDVWRQLAPRPPDIRDEANVPDDSCR